ncbi:sushi, von Willebrand factor type A, EGF and pentraxin domain-containing protein 1 isoform X2 [Scaptodrosophila lebanonensis]|uniref:Sushi, von Willebrand factor type A, EGF and pentraxin domain-containing protein 1 isoform X2 n=1 Tax=Drosophila lebanonensis TaxID=7225 RepID=A0A6J2TQI5_DROLE|nr:sushi, von Willebrand factor type A, EGF and pentraxin domain-containing protein 1 isoform X2 [Scaptodrosophila lebanonensis]
MNRLLLQCLVTTILVYKVISVPTTVSSVETTTEKPQQDDDDDDWDEDDESLESDDDGRVYKNPRNSPSTECPRDEEQATLLGQKCLRKCSSDEDCKSKKKKCLCDGVCGMSCIKPDRECPELAQPSLGQVTVVGRHFGARASYSCPHGYHVVGLQSRLCQADGNWAGAEPACKQNIYCLKPPQIEHARNSALPEQETFDLDSTVQYHCHTGYVTNGFPRAKCLAIDGQASWYGPDIQCEPRSCGQPPDPAYGWHAGECYTYGCKITYNCGTGTGYELVGKHERYCQSDGSWTPKELPTCVSTTTQRRVKRNPSDIDLAYSKYYQKIKERYQRYVKKMLGHSRLYKKIQVQDGRWYNHYNNPELVMMRKATHKWRNPATDYADDNEYREYLGAIVPLPNINQSSRYHSHSHETERSSNETPSPQHSMAVESKHMNATRALIEQLKSQIVRRRRKRSSNVPTAAPPAASLPDADIDTSDGVETSGKGAGGKRLRGPCEELDWDSFGNISVVRPGKAPGLNSVGSILHLECNAGFKLNIKGENATARCIRGIWKPEMPKCLSSPCLVPAVENGQYFKVEPHTKQLSDKPSLTPLSTYEEIQSNEFITLECEEGFNIQGSAQLRCAHGSWSNVVSFSECTSVPCTLPNIPGVIYEGGYRAGLTIGHGSTVSVRCELSTNSNPVEMACHKGVLTPSTIHCESGLRKSRQELEHATPAPHSHVHTSAVKVDHNDLDEHNENNTDEHGGEDMKMCGPPSLTDGALVYKNVEHVEHDGAYESGTEIFFNCIPNAAGDRQTWRIICDNGQWIGRSYNCENGTCLFKNNEANVVSFYNDLEIREDVVEFPPGATIISRCVDIGKFSMTGSHERTCIHSEWTNTKPICSGLNQENDYAMEKAPTILFRHQNGPIAQSNDGKLIVYPGTTLHMECLWMRRFGNPKWNVSHDFKNYTEGWVTEADEGRDSTLEYRLSIFDAVSEDSGIYSCMTPARHEHAVEVVIKAIHCTEIPMRRGLIVNTNDTKLSTRVLLSCSNGNSLIGASELFCLPSGNWSAPLPVCESVECGDILLNNVSSPRVSVLSREVGGRAAFSCPTGYGLRGPSEALCLPSGEWATPFPVCVEVQCENPGAPQNGYAQGSAPYRAGDVVQFNCNPEYMMQGQPIIACQDNGRWSGGLPKCVQACSYPGTAISGRMSSVKFYYAIGESITFTCDAGLELRGSKVLKCMKNGKWSSAIPTCVTVDAPSTGGASAGTSNKHLATMG